MKHPSQMTQEELIEAGEEELTQLDEALETLKAFSRIITIDAKSEDAPTVMQWIRDRMPDQINADVQNLLTLGRIANTMAEGIMKGMAVLTVDDPELMIQMLGALARRNNGRKS